MSGIVRFILIVHCWNYLRNILTLHPDHWIDELKHTMDAIINDPSNHSAWHHRSVAIMNTNHVFDDKFIASG